MKQYVIDELEPAETEKLKEYLNQYFGPAMMGNIYWVPLAAEQYTDLQRSHTDCHPLFFAVELKPDALSCEFLIRTHDRVRCDCIAYATKPQRDWFINYIDSIFEQLEIAA